MELRAVKRASNCEQQDRLGEQGGRHVKYLQLESQAAAVSNPDKPASGGFVRTAPFSHVGTHPDLCTGPLKSTREHPEPPDPSTESFLSLGLNRVGAAAGEQAPLLLHGSSRELGQRGYVVSPSQCAGSFPATCIVWCHPSRELGEVFTIFISR